MIRSCLALAALVLSVSQAHAALWRCEVHGVNLQNAPVVYTGMGTTKGLAMIRAKDKCQKNSLNGLKPCSAGHCTRL